jgi:two-component system chemotaxis sensor kinase CheA
MKKVRFGLNFKILSGIFILLLMCTGFNLLYSYNLFIEDKTSYIYETGLKRSENIVEQIQTYIDSIKNKAQTNAFLSTLESFNFSNYINTEKDYLAAGNAKMPVASDGKLEITNFVKSENFTAQMWTKVPAQEEIKALLEKNLAKQKQDGYNDIVFVHNLNGQAVILSLFKSPASPNIFFTLVDMKPVTHFVENDNIFSNQIAFLDAPSLAKEKATHEWLNLINYKSILKGTQEVNIEGKDKLLSYAVSPDSNFIVASSIDHEKAFGITKFLIIKTALFACVLMGFAIAFGTYFSSTITHPIEVLTKKSTQLAAGDFEQEVVVKTSDELSVLAGSFNWMSKEIKLLLDKQKEMILQLEDYSKNLEKKVEQRTIELKNANDFMGAMINSLDQGLFVFDQTMECHDVYTHACEAIFGMAPPHKQFTQVLGINDETEISNINQWSAILFSEMIPFESAVNLGPRTKVQGTDYTDPNFKHIQIDYYPMKDEDQKIKSIVTVGTDKTLEIQAVEKKKENDQYVSMIIKILNNKTHFKSFCDEADSILTQFAGVYNPETNEVQFDLAMILFHTLNGGFGMYSLTKLQAEARSYESQVTTAREAHMPAAEYHQMLTTQVASLKGNFIKMKQELDALLGTSFEGGEIYKEIPLSTIMHLQQLVNQSSNKELKTAFLEDLVKEPVIDYFKAYEDVCFKAAEKTGKEFAGIAFHNENLKIEAAPLLEFFNVLIHLFRNCIDHGIEAPHRRQELGKPAAGRISVSFDILQNSGVDIFYLNVQDDGSGINSEVIKKRYMSMHPEIDISGYSEKDIINIIFDPFFSTRDEVSALSGRGVGMSAIKEVIEKLGGRINIETKIGVGSSFAFFIPLTPVA